MSGAARRKTRAVPPGGPIRANPRARSFYEKDGWAVDGAEQTVSLRGAELRAA